MKVRFQADNDLNHAILRGVLRREPSIDFRTATVSRLAGLSDFDVLGHAAAEMRLLVTHDRKTMPRHFAQFLSMGNDSPGVIIVSQKTEVREAIDTLILIWTASEAEEWRNRIAGIPLL